MVAPTDYTGVKIGLLTFTKKVGSKHDKALWLCQCQCGGSIQSTMSALKFMRSKGTIVSCGCKGRRKLKGLSVTDQKEYTCWRHILSRCTDKKHPNYRLYGGRGITFFKDWADDPNEFIRYIKQLPHYGKPEYSIDRIDNDGHYEPGNLRWASKQTQAANRTMTRKGSNKYTGVYRAKDCKSERYISQIKHDTVSVVIGRFDSEVDAAIARDEYILANNLEHKLQVLTNG